MTVQPWMAMFVLLALAVGTYYLWFTVWQTPIRPMLFLAVRYRWRRFLDLLSCPRQSPSERFIVDSVRNYEEMFDTILVLKALDAYYLSEFGVKFTVEAENEGRVPPDDMAEFFLAQSFHALSAVAGHLYEQRFSDFGASPEEIFAFLTDERRLVRHDARQMLNHPERLWRRFGRAPIRGWRTRITIDN